MHSKQPPPAFSFWLVLLLLALSSHSCLLPAANGSVFLGSWERFRPFSACLLRVTRCLVVQLLDGTAASSSPSGGGTTAAGRSVELTGQLGSSSHGRGSTSHGCSCGHFDVNVGGCGHGASGCSSALAGSAGAPGESGAGASGKDTMDLDGNDNDTENNDNYEDDALGNGNDNNEDKAPEEADAPLEDSNSRQARLLCGVVCTNEDNGLGSKACLPDASKDSLTVFKAVKLQEPTFYALRSIIRAGGFSQENLPICFRCLRWNLTSLFS